MRRRLPRNSRRIVAFLAILAAWAGARQPELERAERAQLASRFAFERHELAGIAGGETQTIRAVHPDLKRSAGWISAVGGALALSDLDGDSAPAEVIHVDTRRDLVVVEPWPGQEPTFAPFVLAPRSLPYDEETMAPMGVLPGDFDRDGRLDVMVYYWGRSPVLFLRAGADLTGAAFRPEELVEPHERWYTNAATLADLDGDGHLDLLVANYFQDGSRILDQGAEDRAYMQDSMTRAANGGGTYLFLGVVDGTGGGALSSHFVRSSLDGLSPVGRHAWTLALGAADLDGDQLPEVYMANDFGPDVLLHNESVPGSPRFTTVRAPRRLSIPRSKSLGGDSFKGMGVDFADLDKDGRLDIQVSNIAAEFALQESHFVFLHTGDDGAWKRGIAPYTDASERLGLARDGWGWDVRAGDFDNDGSLEILRATGFLAGETRRWAELHETAMSNDQLIRFAWAWHFFEAGDDLCGRQANPFYVRAASGRYYDLGADLGLDDAQVTRAVATADVDCDGDLDFAYGNQWSPSVVYTNVSPAPGRALQLDLRIPLSRESRAPGPSASHGLRTRAAIGAIAHVTLPDGRTLVESVDGGSGHSGVKSPVLHFGLGRVGAHELLLVRIEYRDATGRRATAHFSLEPGRHRLLLGSDGIDSEGLVHAREVQR